MAFSTVLRADGTVVAARPELLRRACGQVLAATVLKLALDRSTMVFDDLKNRPNGQMLLFGVPFSADGELRVWIASLLVETIIVLAAGYLESSLGSRASRAYIVDINGLVTRHTQGVQWRAVQGEQRSRLDPLPSVRVPDGRTLNGC
jgi:hypothetical protein